MLQRGWVYSFGILFNRVIPRWFFRFGIFDIFVLDEKGLLRNDSSFDDVEIWEAKSPDQRLSAREVTRNPFRLQEIMAHRGWVAVQGDQYVGGVWVAQERFFERDLGVQLLLQEGQEWIYCAYVDSQHRRNGIYDSLLKALAESPSPVKHDRFLVAANPFNRRSFGIHASKSERRIGRVIAIRLFSFGYVFANGELKCNRRFTPNCFGAPVQISMG